MKTSYKLYGSAWDGRMIPKQCPSVKSMELDSNNERIKLSVQMDKEMPEIVNHNGNLVLDIDFIPEITCAVIWDFYLKRLLQIVEFYQVKSVCCSNVDQVDVLNDKLKDFYKRKTPKRSLAQSVGAFQMIC